jgi:hypothetical protein
LEEGNEILKGKTCLKNNVGKLKLLWYPIEFIKSQQDMLKHTQINMVQQN